MDSLTQVTYNRQDREYVVRNGHEIARFPSGPEGKAGAQWCAIAHDNLDVFFTARDMLPQGHEEGRLIKAARIVVEGGLKGDYVKSQSQDAWYLVERRELVGYHCECVDYERGREGRFHSRPDGAPTVNGQTACKHVLARMIVETLQAEIDQVAQCKLADKLERAARRSVPADAPLTRIEREELAELRREQDGDEKPWYLKADPMNRKGSRYAQAGTRHTWR